jgi:outer membrane cobalamin receptor
LLLLILTIPALNPAAPPAPIPLYSQTDNKGAGGQDGFDQAPQTDPEETQTLVVQGKRGALSTTSTTIDLNSLESAATASVSEALTGTPGVEINSDPKMGDFPYLRGFDEKRSLFLVDGIPVKEVYAGYYDLSSLAASRASGLEIERGVTSVLYGPGSLGGVIRIFSRRPTRGLSADGRVYGGNQDRSRPRDLGADLFTGYGARTWDASLSGAFQHSDGYALSDDFKTNPNNLSFHEDGGLRTGSGFDRGSLSARLGWRPDPTLSVSLVSHYFNQRRTMPPFEGANYVRYWEYTHYYTLASGLTVQWLPRRAPLAFQSLDLVLWHQRHADQIRDRGNPQYQGLTSDPLAWFAISDYQNDSLGLQLLPVFAPLRGNRLEASLALTRDIHREDEVRVPGAPSMTWQGEKKSLADTLTLAAEDRQRLGPLTLLLGLGWSRQFMADQVFRGKTYPRTGPGSDVKDAFDYRGVLRWQLPRGLTLVASAGHKTRFPGLRELYSNAVGGNPDLRPEYAWMGELGFDLVQASVLHGTLGFRGFYSAVQDMIDSQPGKPYANIGQATLAGTEAWLKSSWSRHLDSTLSHTWTYARDEAAHQPLPFRTRHVVSLLVNARADTGTSLSAKALFRSGQAAWLYSLASSAYTVEEVPGSFVLDLFLRQDLLKGPRGLYAFAQFRNVLDENYSVGSFDPQPGRTWLLGVGGSL